MDSAELTGWIAWGRHKAAREQEQVPARRMRELSGGL
jgi:hypothetical protein